MHEGLYSGDFQWWVVACRLYNGFWSTLFGNGMRIHPTFEERVAAHCRPMDDEEQSGRWQTLQYSPPVEHHKQNTETITSINIWKKQNKGWKNNNYHISEESEKTEQIQEPQLTFYFSMIVLRLNGWVEFERQHPRQWSVVVLDDTKYNRKPWVPLLVVHLCHTIALVLK